MFQLDKMWIMEPLSFFLKNALSKNIEDGRGACIDNYTNFALRLSREISSVSKKIFLKTLPQSTFLLLIVFWLLTVSFANFFFFPETLCSHQDSLQQKSRRGIDCSFPGKRTAEPTSGGHSGSRMIRLSAVYTLCGPGHTPHLHEPDASPAGSGGCHLPRVWCGSSEAVIANAPEEVHSLHWCPIKRVILLSLRKEWFLLLWPKTWCAPASELRVVWSSAHGNDVMRGAL